MCQNASNFTVHPRNIIKRTNPEWESTGWIKWMHRHIRVAESRYDKYNKVACAPRKDSDHPGHPPRLIKVFGVHLKGR